MADLTSFPTLVEAPFIIMKVGNYTFGNATKNRSNSYLDVTFPNYMESLTVTKINGEINQYVIKLVYQITAGDDPNMLDRVFSSVSNTRKITLSYGDWAFPSHIYKEEEALIINVKSTVSFSASKITYEVDAISTAMSLMSTSFYFPARTAKPSSILMEMLRNSKYGMRNVFKGMSLQNILLNNLISSDDSVVKLDAKPQTTVWSYMTYLVDSMISTTGDATYRLSVIDDNKNSMNGSYFKVTKVSKNSSTVNNLLDAYEINIGYPDNNFVTDFNILDSEYYQILYEESMKANQEQYIYRISNLGEVTRTLSPSLTRSKAMLVTQPENITWWKNVTEFPIQATLVIKGLVRPTILMDYIKLNVIFYGQKHISSGTYIITKQVDAINSSGYKTTLTLLRIKGDS